MQDVSKNPGVWPNHYGTTATSLPFLALPSHLRGLSAAKEN
jgi:hypothetical protein